MELTISKAMTKIGPIGPIGPILIRPILKSAHLSAPFDAPNRLHLLASYAINLIVHVQRRADVIRNDAESIADAVAPLGTRDVQVTVLLGKPFNHRIVIFRHQSKPNTV